MTKEFKFPSKSSPGKSYTTLLYADGTTSCNCRGWTTKRSGAERACVHTKQVEAAYPVGNQVADKSEATLDVTPRPRRVPIVDVTVPVAPGDDVEPMAAGVLKGDDLTAAWLDVNRVAEEKLDGARYVLHLLDGPAKLFSRRKSVTDGLRIEKSANVPHLRDLKHNMAVTILDGEITVGSSSKSNDVTRIMGSNSLRAAEVQSVGIKAVYKVFDILKLRGENLRDLPYAERYEILKSVVAELGSKYVVLPRRTTENKEQFYKDILAEGGEGVILKDLREPYVEGSRTTAWVKVKRNKTWNVVAMGFTKGKNAFAETFGAIKFGLYIKGKLVEVGQCSGLPLKLRQEVSANRKAYIGKVLEVTGQEMTEGGRIRHPQFKEWRLDVDPKTVTLEDESKSL